jgi:tetratricopeptide (TPR) repeat protein
MRKWNIVVLSIFLTATSFSQTDVSNQTSHLAVDEKTVKLDKTLSDLMNCVDNDQAYRMLNTIERTSKFVTPNSEAIERLKSFSDRKGITNGLDKDVLIKSKMILGRLMVRRGDIVSAEALYNAAIKSGVNDAYVWYVDSLIEEKQYKTASIYIFKSSLNEKIIKSSMMNMATQFLGLLIEYRRENPDAFLVNEIQSSLEEKFNDQTELIAVSRSFCELLDGMPKSAVARLNKFNRTTAKPLSISEREDMTEIVEAYTRDNHIFLNLPIYKLALLVLQNSDQNYDEMVEHVEAFISRNSFRPEYILRMLTSLIENAEKISVNRLKTLPITTVLIDKKFDLSKTYVSEYTQNGLTDEYWRLHLIDLHMMGLYKQRNLNKAQELCNRIISESLSPNPAFLNAVNHVSAIAAESGDFESAVQGFQSVIDAFPNSITSQIARGQLVRLLNKMGRNKDEIQPLIQEIVRNTTEKEKERYQLDVVIDEFLLN